MGWGEYGGRVLGKILEAAWEQAQTGTGKLVHYRQLPQVIWSELVPFWKADFAPEAVEKMAGVVRFDAKNPRLPYADDTLLKARGVTDEIRGITRQWLDPPYRRLEALRLEQLGQAACRRAIPSARANPIRRSLRNPGDDKGEQRGGP